MSPLITEVLNKLHAGLGTRYPPEQLHRDLKEFLDLCAADLAGASRADQVEVLHEVAFLLGDLQGNVQGYDQIWFWLRHLAKGADLQLRDALTAAIFVLVPDDPVDDRGLMCLWACIEDVRTRWVIAEAYDLQPEKMLPHFVRYIAGSGTI